MEKQRLPVAGRLSFAASILLLAACSDRPPMAPGHHRPAGGPPPMEAGPRGRRLFISPMGEPFRDSGDGRAPEASWFAGAGGNNDGRLTLAEFSADAARFFAILDSDHDGEIGPSEIEHYEKVLAPEISIGGAAMAGRGGSGHRGGRRGGGEGGGGERGGGGHGGGFGGGAGGGEAGGSDERRAGPDTGAEGAGRFGYIGLPEPVIAADTNFNRGVSREEFIRAAAQRFAMLDRDHDGAVIADELPKLRGGRQQDAPPSAR